jgi:dTDP-4-dehydrorhamnose reductase
MRVLVTGRSGQLATALLECAKARPGIDLLALGRPAIDLERPKETEAAIIAARPDLVVNAAAYTAVDGAESEPDRAFAINRDGAVAVARAAARLGVPLIHLSTDYVFDGTKPQAEAYAETDTTNPLSLYGRSKLEGERAVMAAHPDAVVLRTSWVYSPYGSNFVRTMLRVGGERPLLRVVEDQTGNPTSAVDLAAAILRIGPTLSAQPGGIYHLTGSGSTSWHGLAAFIFSESAARGGPNPKLEAIATSDYPTLAMRPANSRLDCSAFEQRFGFRLRSWEDATRETVAWLLSARTLSHKAEAPQSY